jgi:hypothetical protein
MARSPAREHHEHALRYLTAQALCCDIARSHATMPPVIRRYEEIALGLLCKRSKRLSLMQQVTKNKLTEQIHRSDRDEALWEQDLAAVFNDQSYSLERRREALRQLEEFKNEHERRRERLFGQLVSASLSPIHFEPSMVRLARRRKRVGESEFFCHLDAIICRYLNARESGATWVGSLPLLHLFALEWTRDRESLWDFIEACFQRWEEVTAPMGTHRQSVEMHSSIVNGVYRVTNGALTGPFPVNGLKEVPVILKEMGAISAADANQGVALYDRLRRRSSRNIKASFEFSPVPYVPRPADGNHL